MQNMYYKVRFDTFRKQRRALSAELHSLEQQRKWHEEREALRALKRDREAGMRAAMEAKRRREAEENAARLEDSRRRLVQSQELLKRLIREKEERSENARREAERYVLFIHFIHSLFTTHMHTYNGT